jgi:hypothetical protein
MRLPGFAAEASLYRHVTNVAVVSAVRDRRSRVEPQVICPSDMAGLNLCVGGCQLYVEGPDGQFKCAVDCLHAYSSMFCWPWERTLSQP